MTRRVQGELFRLDRPSTIPYETEPPAPPPPVSSPRIGRQPDIRCPYDVTHDEGFLLRCLIRHYGWTWAEPGLLRRPDTTIAATRVDAS